MADGGDAHRMRFSASGAALVLLAAGVGVLVGCRADEAGPASVGDAVFPADRVAEVRIVMSDDDWAGMRDDPLDKRYAVANVAVDGEEVRNVAVRPKGSSSLRSVADLGTPQLGLTVDFNLLNSARSFDGLRKIDLNTGFKYHLLLRARLASELFAEMGVAAPRTAFADVWVNGTRLGAYALVEHVDRTFLRRHFDSDDGNLYKPAGEAGPLGWTEADVDRPSLRAGSAEVNLGGGSFRDLLDAVGEGRPSPDRRDMEPEGFISAAGLKTNENRPDHAALLRFLEVLNHEPDSTFPEAIERVLDVDGALRFLAVSAVTVHLDSYLGSARNYYLYEDDGRFTMVPWDMNEAFGTFRCGIERSRLIDLYVDEPTAAPLAERPLVARLLAHPPYLDAYRGYVRELVYGPLAPGAAEARIDRLAGLLAPLVEDVQSAESRRLSELDYDLPASTLDSPAAVAELKSFVAARTESVRRQLVGTQPSASRLGAGNGASDIACGAGV